MSKLGILASVLALTVGTVGCGNSQGQSNSLADVGPSMVSNTSSEEGGGNLATLAKGGRNTGGSGGGTISLVLLDSPDGLPHFKGVVTFSVSTSVTAYPYVTLRCFQNNAVVSGQTNAMFPGSLGENFHLGPSSAWTTGAADCTANLEDRYSSKNS